MLPDWLKFKKYPHIGIPLTKVKDAKWLLKYVRDPEKIANHKFLPLLHKKMCQRKYRPNKDANKNEYGKRERKVQKKKERPIYYSSHFDSIIYSYYCQSLMKSYEDYLLDKEYSQSIVAYRKIPIKKGKKPNKSSIEFAYESFKFIKECEHQNLTIIVADITSFFDNLDHRILHSKWKEILGTETLPDDHYNVFKSLIRKRYVNEADLFRQFQSKLIVERGEMNNDSKTVLKNKFVKNIWNLKDERVKAFCTKEDFLKEATHLIHNEKACSKQHKRCRGNCEVKGIPQGTPISAMLANVYMLDFDERVYAQIKEKNAYYQRYSDDLIIVCNREDEKFFNELITTSIEDLAKLDIQPEKTKLYHYDRYKDFLVGGIVEGGEVSKNRQLEYLGFVFDGKRVRVKSSGLSKFYRGMKRAIKRGTHYASIPQNKSNQLFQERLYKRFTFKGAKRRLIFKPDPSSENGFKKSKEQYWGNYISYLQKANMVMKPLNNGEDVIKKQASKFWPNFEKEIKKAKKKIDYKLAIHTIH